VTRTEERLIDALDAVGRSVRQETLPPLPARGPATGPRRWGRWLAPLAAAASVVLIVVAISAVPQFSGPPPQRQAMSPPRYYATLGEGGIVIRATATGTMTGTVPNERPGHGGFGRYASSVAAADGGREFVVAYSGTVASYAAKTWLYSFRLTSAGRVTGLTPVRGGVFTGLLAASVMAVSPDGSNVAVVLNHPLDPSVGTPPAELGVVNLRTGQQTLWTGGMNRAGLEFNIANVSWERDGRSLVFLAVWCRSEVFGSEYCTAGPHDAQVRTLRLTPGGGRLSQGGVLLADSRRYPDIIQALLGPGGKSLTMVVLTGRAVGGLNPQPRYMRVVQVPLAGGRPRVLFRGAVGGHPDVFLGSDASGRYLLLAWGRNGWIDHGRLRPLPPQGGMAFTDAW